MQPLNPNLKIAIQILTQHSSYANKITSTLLVIAFIIWFIVLKLIGHKLSFELFVSYFTHYKYIIIITVLFIHFIPVNLYAIIKTLQHRYRHFRIVLLASEENHEIDHRSDKTL